ncbi:6391_t:CDS:2 [Ambispora gerdemannii]|uniref:6391_t:CDS:1 n=1 Tax=Ambispora gerdemannii TaxID=144530 RepID=A0A9N8ZBH9_9GLOM|nr:6391_t:CDS:2 [Ambispora gerdemannii]
MSPKHNDDDSNSSSSNNGNSCLPLQFSKMANKLNSEILKTFCYLMLCTSWILGAFASPLEKRDTSAGQQNQENVRKITAHTVILGIILIIVGVIYCFFGRRFYRLTMFLLGFYVGSLITWVILTNAEPNNGYGKAASVILLVVSLAVGLIIGLITMCCADLAVWILGGLAGYTVALFILALADNGIIHSKAGRIIFILIFIIAGFLLMFFFKNIMIILSTAFIGAYSIILGLDMFVRTGFKESVRLFMDGNHDIVYNATWKVYLMLAALLALFILGSIFQWSYHRDRHFGYLLQTMPSEKKRTSLLPPPGLQYHTPPQDTLVDDLRYALEHSRELFADIAWEFSMSLKPTIIYAHKSILYARSSRSFQERFLKNKDANGMSIRSVRISNTEPIAVKTDADPYFFKQELKFFYTAEEGSQEFLAAVDTTEELEQEKLKEDLLYMLKSKLYTDVELILSMSEESLEIFPDEDFTSTSHRAHRFMLASRSEYFKAMLSSQFIEARVPSVHLDATIFTPTSLNVILSFIYTGNLTSSSKKPLTLETIEMVWIGADFLGIKTLCDECIYRIATKVHAFACTCIECQTFIPRIASFAKEHSIDKLWHGCLHVLSEGFDDMWPQKIFAELEEETREEVVLTLLSNIQSHNIVATFKGCRRVLAQIEVKGIGLPWIEIVRGSINQVRSYTAGMLVDNFVQLCENDAEFLDCVDGVGFSSDLLEDIMNVVVDEGLTEQNAGTVLKCITGNLLMREAVKDAQSMETKRILVQAKQNVYEYMKKRWIGIKQIGGFQGLSDWLLSEFAQDLGTTTAELTEDVEVAASSSSAATATTEQKPPTKARASNSTNGIRDSGKHSSSSPAFKINRTATAPSTKSKAPSSNSSKTNSATTSPTSATPSTTTLRRAATTNSVISSNDAASSSTSGSSNSNNINGSNSNSSVAEINTRKTKSVRIAAAASTFGRPTRASVLRQKALAEAAMKNPVKKRTSTAPSRLSTAPSRLSTVSTNNSKTANTSTKPKTSASARASRSSSTSLLQVPGTSSSSSTSQTRGRNSTKQTNASTASSRASSISSAHSQKSPSVSPSRFSGVRQTRASMLRQLKFDETEQRRGRDTERSNASPASSRASSIASVSSVASSTASSSAVHPKRSPSQYSTSTTMTSTSTGSISSLPAKPHQIKLSTTKDPDISVGRRVILPTKNNAPGTIQFLGETEFAKGHWVGIELDNPVGKNNGTVANIQYFETASNQGIFVRPDSILII